jgi:TfoX/Sxy family transcriptional regulator of competence genes
LREQIASSTRGNTRSVVGWKDASDYAREPDEQHDHFGDVSFVRFFSGAGLRANEVQIAFVIDDILSLKVDMADRDEFESDGLAPLAHEDSNGRVTATS